MYSHLNVLKPIYGLLIMACIFGCKPEKFTSDSADKLSFTYDTIVFDTIVAQLYIGTPKSVNRQFVVRNTHDKSIKTTLFLAGGTKSQFRINVDGDPGTYFSDIEIRPHDSIFVFVEAYANPNLDPLGNALIIRDSIVFSTNGNFQNVQLVAWGQDAVYYMKDSISTDMVWANKLKPYVIYDYFYVKPGATLTIKEGVKVYFAPYSTLYTEGTLNVLGTANEPVIFEGDRTSDKYSDKFSIYKYFNVPGQWFGLRFGWPSTSNTLNHARIKNATYGIFIDSSSSNGQPNVMVNNTSIQNMAAHAVKGNRSKVIIENSLLANCGSACLYTYKGGDYELRHVTVSGYCDFGGSNDPALAVTNRLRNGFGQIVETYPGLKFKFLNSIVYGDLADEVALDIDVNIITELPSIFGSLLPTSNTSLGQAGTQNKINIDPKFKSIVKYRFDLDTLSPAQNCGIALSPPLNFDYSGKPRDSKPDAGAFERID